MALPGLAVLVLTLAAPGAPAVRWADYVEPGFPFYSSVADARTLAADGWPAHNLTSRGLILKPASNLWVCFDTELLRWSAVWQGGGLTPDGMAPGSYHNAGRKADPGQGQLPVIIGTPWLATGLYPGWQTGAEPSRHDPRDPGIDPRELSRGPLEESRFRRIRLTRAGLELDYSVAGAAVTEWIEAREEDGQPVLQRAFRVGPGAQALWLILGERPAGAAPLAIALSARPPLAELAGGPDGLLAARIRPRSETVELRVTLRPGTRAEPWFERPSEASAPAAARWTSSVTTSLRHTSVTNGFSVEHIGLPDENPWRRNVRLADLAFLEGGRAAAVTFDGDVWMIDGFREGVSQFVWRRFASGLHEPMGIAARDGELFVHDRNGIWTLRDTDGNGEADEHELFSNAFTQTAETREFAAGLRLAPDRSFVIGKGGIQAAARGRHNGTVLRIAPDGRSATVLGWGFREPFIGVHPRTGLVTASDQQGNYIPTTPLHRVRGGQFYGFLTGLEPRGYEAPPAAEPLAWIPHPVNASGVGQVWLTDARMGPLNDALIHLGYYRPEIFVARLNERGAELEAAVISLTRDLRFAPLHGAVNPADGLLYVTGFQIWGSDALDISGLARLRPAGDAFPLPREIVPMTEGVLLRFDLPLDPSAAVNPANYSAERWEYRRTAAYGSPHYRLDGTRGQEALIPGSAYLSRDGRAVFIGIPAMRPVMQMRIGWTLAARDGSRLSHSAYFTPRELRSFDPDREGFAPVRVDLTPRAAEAAAPAEVSAAEGARLTELMGCVACHSTDGSTVGKTGPSFKGLYLSERQFADGRTARADESYLRESIQEPGARVVRGFDRSDIGMPSYDGVLTGPQIESLILYLKTVR